MQASTACCVTEAACFSVIILTFSYSNDR